MLEEMTGRYEKGTTYDNIFGIFVGRPGHSIKFIIGVVLIVWSITRYTNLHIFFKYIFLFIQVDLDIRVINVNLWLLRVKNENGRFDCCGLESIQIWNVLIGWRTANAYLQDGENSLRYIFLIDLNMPHDILGNES